VLAYVPVVFEHYRPLKPHLRWTLQCLVGFADRAGRCFPSVRKLAEVTGSSKSSVSRHLAALTCAGALSRQRRPGGVYIYTVDQKFLPARVSHRVRNAVPAAHREEKPGKKNPLRGGDSALPDSRPQWQARLRSWGKSGFWLPQWGPKPGEAGCFAPTISAASARALSL
jgi:DNA-binding transcriptional ArsR family regulator